RSKYAPTDFSTLSSSSINRTFSPMSVHASGYRVRVHEYHERARDDSCLERRFTHHFAIQLCRNPRRAGHLDPHRPAAAEPHLIAADGTREQQLEERRDALPGPFGPQRHDVQDAVVGADVG